MSTDEQTKSLPRLTGTLRAFSRVSPRYDELSAHAESNLMKRRREQLLGAQSTAGSRTTSTNANRTWSNLVDALVSEKNNTKFGKLKTLLDKLRMNMSKQFLNEDFNDAGLLNEASMFIFESFYDHRSRSLASNSHFEGLDKLNKKLKEKFGQFQKNLFDQTRDLVEQIFTEIDSLDRMSVLNEFFKSKNVLVDVYTLDVGFLLNSKFFEFLF